VYGLKFALFLAYKCEVRVKVFYEGGSSLLLSGYRELFPEAVKRVGREFITTI